MDFQQSDCNETGLVCDNLIIPRVFFSLDFLIFQKIIVPFPHWPET